MTYNLNLYNVSDDEKKLEEKGISFKREYVDGEYIVEYDKKCIDERFIKRKKIVYDENLIRVSKDVEFFDTFRREITFSKNVGYFYGQKGKKLEKNSNGKQKVCIKSTTNGNKVSEEIVVNSNKNHISEKQYKKLHGIMKDIIVSSLPNRKEGLNIDYVKFLSDFLPKNKDVNIEQTYLEYPLTMTNTERVKLLETNLENSGILKQAKGHFLEKDGFRYFLTGFSVAELTDTPSQS